MVLFQEIKEKEYNNRDSKLISHHSMQGIEGAELSSQVCLMVECLWRMPGDITPGCGSRGTSHSKMSMTESEISRDVLVVDTGRGT